MSRVKDQVIKIECLRLLEKLRDESKRRKYGRRYNSVRNESAQVSEVNYQCLTGEMREFLVALESQWKLLSNTHSTMARRHVMSMMLRTIVGCAGQLKECPGATAAVEVLKKWLEDDLAGHAFTNARYNKVICVGYRVQTRSTHGYRAIAAQLDDYDDMRERCENMKEAIRAAHRLVSENEQTNPQLLKIFMAPEFFFRGRNGGYDYDVVLGLVPRKAGPGRTQVQARQGLLEIMREEIGKPIYNDWLFVLGTVVLLSEHIVCKSCEAGLEVKGEGGAEGIVCKGDPRHALARKASVENVAYVCKEREIYPVSKEFISTEDFMPDARRGDRVTLRGRELEVERHVPRFQRVRSSAAAGGAASGRPTKFYDERMGGCIFTLDGVTFGLEIGFDHDHVTGPADLWTRRAPSQGRLDHAGNIQIQLLPSTRTNVERLQTVPNGVVFKVDGFDPSVQAVGQRGLQTEVFEFSRAHCGVLSGDVRAFAQWSPDHIVAALQPGSTQHQKGWIEVPAKNGPAPGGSVVLYGPFEIPRV